MIVRHATMLVAVAVLLPLAGCAKGPKDKLQGKWIGDRIENVTAEQVVKATGWVKGMTMEFSGDEMTVTIPAEQPRRGAFKVAKAEANKMTVAVARSDGQGADEATLTLAEDKSLHWDIGEGREIVLVHAMQ